MLTTVQAAVVSKKMLWAGRVISGLAALFFGRDPADGYLGGATASHLRIGEPFWFPVVFGVLIWAGLFLRDDRLRALIPLRTQAVKQPEHSLT